MQIFVAGSSRIMMEMSNHQNDKSGLCRCIVGCNPRNHVEKKLMCSQFCVGRFSFYIMQHSTFLPLIVCVVFFFFFFNRYSVCSTRLVCDQFMHSTFNFTIKKNPLSSDPISTARISGSTCS